METIKGLKVTSSIKNPTGAPAYKNAFYTTGSMGDIRPGEDGDSLSYNMVIDAFVSEAACDAGKTPINNIKRNYTLNLTTAQLKGEGNSVWNYKYLALEAELKAEGMTVVIVNEA
jgi:hypothetical protein